MRLRCAKFFVFFRVASTACDNGGRDRNLVFVWFFLVRPLQHLQEFCGLEFHAA